MKRNFLRNIFILAAFFLLIAGCAPRMLVEEKIPEGELRITPDVPWTFTAVTVRRGSYLKITAYGKVELGKKHFRKRGNYDRVVGPQGTYNYPPSADSESFPLPAAEGGPAPCYALIGKIGQDGFPFLVGTECERIAARAGALYLGINDPHPDDNKGAFYARVETGAAPPAGMSFHIDERRIENEPRATKGTPVPDADVLLIYIDGARRDVVRQMAYNGYLPNIKRIFFEGGCEVPNTFCTFPSTTQPSNAAFLSGLFPDKTGIKNVTLFDRKTGKIKALYEKFAASEAADIIRPASEKSIGLFTTAFLKKTFGTREAYSKFVNSYLIGPSCLYDYAEQNNVPFKSTIVPVLPRSAPPFWGDVAQGVVPPFRSYMSREYIDEINFEYAYNYVITEKARIMMVWFPGLDHRCHNSVRGQFGAARKNLVKVDDYIGRFERKLKLLGKLDNTYMILMSDHGMVGGKRHLLQRFSLIDDLFYKKARSEGGALVQNSGFGFNVKTPLKSKIRMGTSSKDFVFLEYLSGGTIQAYLPVGAKNSRDWSRRNTFYELTHYKLSDDLDNVNLLEHILYLDKEEENKYPGKVSSYPVNFILVKIDEDTVLLMDGISQALIIRKKTDGEDLFAYKPIKDFAQDENGAVSCTTRDDDKDPLGYLSEAAFVPARKEISRKQWLEGFHSARAWLKATYMCEYPASVPLFFKFLSWEATAKKYEKHFAPDFVMLLNPGWNSSEKTRPSTTHSYPNRDSMQTLFFFSGPNIRKNTVIEKPHFLIDLLPTILDMTGIKYDEASLDGRPVSSIYETGELLVEDPLGGLPKRPVNLYTDRGYKVFYYKTNTTLRTIDNPNSPFDLHSIFENLLGLFGVRVFPVADSGLDLATGTRPGESLVSGFEAIERAGESPSASKPKKRAGDLVNSMQVPELSVGDVTSAVTGSFMSGGNLRRLGLFIDFLQNCSSDIDEGVSKPFGKKRILQTHRTNKVIDGAQNVARNLQEMTTKYFVIFAEGLIDGVENSVDFVINFGRTKEKDVEEE